jgi:Icc-related predicted phosphoesterase
MRIMQIGGINGDDHYLALAIDHANSTGIDLVCCTGDLLGKPAGKLSVLEANDNFEVVFNYAKENLVQAKSIDDLVENIMGDKTVPDQIRVAAKKYHKTDLVFNLHSNEQYQNLKEVFNTLVPPVFIIPGSSDSAGFFDYFRDFGRVRSLHDNHFSFEDMSFAGYGTDPSNHGNVPLSRVIPTYSADIYYHLFISEPNVVLTYVPPYSLCDRNKDNHEVVGDTSSFAALATLRTIEPDLWLCGSPAQGFGHIQDNKTRTYVVNSGNLGRTDRELLSGTFSEISLNQDNYVTSVDHFQFTNDGLIKLEVK